MADGSQFRDLILERYDFTPEAQEILRGIPVDIKDPDRPTGGGFWIPNERRIVLNGAQDEACLHELSHAWADEAGFYVDPHPNDPGRPGRHFAFRADVERAAADTDPRFQRVAFLAWEYTYGNPATGFQGMGELDWERFAGLASGVMGDTRLMPDYLSHWYNPLFGGNPAIPGPLDVPNWAPLGWRPGKSAVQYASPTFSRDIIGWLQRFIRWLRTR
jgi:hypothetical protein